MILLAESLKNLTLENMDCYLTRAVFAKLETPTESPNKTLPDSINFVPYFQKLL